MNGWGFGQLSGLAELGKGALNRLSADTANRDLRKTRH
jgi:hypothetical protein